MTERERKGASVEESAARAAGEPSLVQRLVGRIGVRLLLVNLLVLLVPVAGLELARIHERQLLESLERDMKNQAALVRALVEEDLDRDIPLGDPRHASVLTVAASTTRTRIRLLDVGGGVIADSHEYGPPEGPEPPPPHLARRRPPGAAPPASPPPPRSTSARTPRICRSPRPRCSSALCRRLRSITRQHPCSGLWPGKNWC